MSQKIYRIRSSLGNWLGDDRSISVTCPSAWSHNKCNARKFTEKRDAYDAAAICLAAGIDVDIKVYRRYKPEPRFCVVHINDDYYRVTDSGTQCPVAAVRDHYTIEGLTALDRAVIYCDALNRWDRRRKKAAI